MTNRALPAAYSIPSGLSLTVALTHVLRPSMESSEAMQMMFEPAGIGCKRDTESDQSAAKRNNLSNELCILSMISITAPSFKVAPVGVR